MILKDLIQKISRESVADRIGPDILTTHWRLHFPSLMRTLCVRKFKYFGHLAEFRPGAYAIGCSKISIGSRVVIRPGTMLFADPREGPEGSITISDDVLIGSGVHVYVNNHSFEDIGIPIIDQGHRDPGPVFVDYGAWIGAGVIILPGVSIGKNAVIGAGAVVTRDVLPYTVIAGNPAKKIRDLVLTN